MDEKNLAKKSIFTSKTGPELAEKMCAFFKKYTIPEMKTAVKDDSSDVTKIFDGKLPLYADMPR